MDHPHKHLTRDDKKLILSATLLLFLLILFGSLSLWYQIQRLKRVRMKRKQHASTALVVDNERKSVYQIQKSAMISRKQMQDRMEKEVETLRVFQEELRGQVDLLKVAFARKSMEGDNVIVSVKKER